MIYEAIILAGGLGTRLRDAVPDKPKPMAPVDGKPFLEYLLLQLKDHEVENVILSVGYKWRTILTYFGSRWNGMNLTYAIEHEPMGTGGGIFLAAQHAKFKRYFILNGDSYFNVPLRELEKQHVTSGAMLSLALKPMKDFERYGTVETDKTGKISAFHEKRPCEKGLINAGVYVMEAKAWKSMTLPQKFSFEKEVLEGYCNKLPFFGFPYKKDFIDIGIPEDYARAKTIMKKSRKKAI
jgi:D-glycero-alpha-D-manno-heptose 1-phosphate guanylyltransferase